MWYHPSAFALGWRDIVAAWIVCFAAAALLVGCCVLARTDDVESPPQAASPPRTAPVAESHRPHPSS
jgi:hypothetical protein